MTAPVDEQLALDGLAPPACRTCSHPLREHTDQLTCRTCNRDCGIDCTRSRSIYR